MFLGILIFIANRKYKLSAYVFLKIRIIRNALRILKVSSDYSNCFTILSLKPAFFYSYSDGHHNLKSANRNPVYTIFNSTIVDESRRMTRVNLHCSTSLREFSTLFLFFFFFSRKSYNKAKKNELSYIFNIYIYRSTLSIYNNVSPMEFITIVYTCDFSVDSQKQCLNL